MRILVVDDDAVGRTKLEVLLSAYGQCETAESGTRALALYDKALEQGSPYDLITMDIDMPGLSGQDTVRMLREREAKLGPSGSGNASKILMVTAMDDIKNIQSSFWEGCEGYLTKPVTPANLKAQLDAMNIFPVK